MDELRNYIKIARSKNVSDELIVDSLLKNGWTKDQVDHSISSVGNLGPSKIKYYLQWLFPVICFGIVAATTTLWAIRAMQ